MKEDDDGSRVLRFHVEKITFMKIYIVFINTKNVMIQINISQMFKGNMIVTLIDPH